MLRRFVVVLTLIVLAASVFWYVTRPTEAPPRPPITGGSADLSGFARATTVVDFSFPRDHGPHFDYQTEWWYYTGNLAAEDGQRFGYQLTFFRRGLTPGAPGDLSGLATNQIYFAHFALTDVARGTHHAVERFSRGAAGLAGAQGAPFGVWLEDWKAESLNAEGSAVRLVAQDGEMALDLNLRAVKPLVAHGDHGLTMKSAQPGAASYYLSFTRMATEGALTMRGQRFAVSGESWSDHEWSTGAMGTQTVGWDWFSLQLSDGREIMLYFLRRAEGGLESVSGGTLIEPDGSTARIAQEAVNVEALGEWVSPATQAQYPSGWKVSIPSAQIELTVEPWLDAQEMQLMFAYWEGAVRISGTSGGVAVTGHGFVELTGYAASMQGVF
jgi:predicted secreted hydrolase